METSERQRLIDQYERGPADLEAALQEVPTEALQWRPEPGEWSVHEIIVHCADSETSGYTRIRMLAVEPEPLLVGYDQDEWATAFAYHARSIDDSLAVVKAVRHHTATLIRTFPDAWWDHRGRHTESGVYTSEDWLRTYGVHLSDHADQIRRNVAAWNAQH